MKIFLSIASFQDPILKYTIKSALENAKYKRESILWFTARFGKKREDFDYVCDLADIEPNYMRRVAMEILTSKRTNFVRNHINALLTHKDSYDRIKLKNRKGK